MTYLRQLNRVHPFETLGRLHDDMRRRALGQMHAATAPRAKRAWQPPFTLHESELAFEVRFLLPGVDPERLEVSVEGDVLRVSGERPGIPDDARRRFTNERCTGAFARAIEFPTPVDSEHIAARYRDGILHVTLPRAAEARPRRIDVRYDTDVGDTDTPQPNAQMDAGSIGPSGDASNTTQNTED